jgi:hypothetical protein
VKFLFRDKDTRSGKPRVFVRKYAHKVRLRETEGTPAFQVEYEAGLKYLERFRPDEPVKPSNARTVRWLATKYFASTEFLALDAQSQRT